MKPTHPPDSRRVRVVVLEDDQRFADELRTLLRDSDEFECASVCETVEDALEIARKLQPSIFLADLRLQGNFRPDAIQAARRIRPRMVVLVLTAYEEPDLLFRALRAGADGYVLKGDSSRPLLDALRSALAEVPPLSPRVTRRILQHFRAEGAEHERSGVPSLTARQLQVLKLVHQGFSNPEIARQLAVTPDAVKMHVGSILAKLRVDSRVEAAAVYERSRRPAS